MEKLASLDKYLEAAMAKQDGPEAQIILRLMPTIGNKKIVKDLFKGTNEELLIQRRIIMQCFEHLKGSVCQAVADSLRSKSFAFNET